MNNILSLDDSAYYSIQIQGVLDQDWADQFGDLKVYITQPQKTSRTAVTTIVGRVTDQAALAGLLNLAYNMRLPLLSVSYLGES
jgi:hypothetical protein